PAGGPVLGPDLAAELVRRQCPEALPGLGILVGYDSRLHGDLPAERGKRHHMRRIQQHYGVPFGKMLLLVLEGSKGGWGREGLPVSLGFDLFPGPGGDFKSPSRKGS
ncbi:unnamed protein product, partial [Prorocentrum cordatum]